MRSGDGADLGGEIEGGFAGKDGLDDPTGVVGALAAAGRHFERRYQTIEAAGAGADGSGNGTFIDLVADADVHGHLSQQGVADGLADWLRAVSPEPCCEC